MSYIISAEKIVQKSCRMILDESALPGVKRIAGIVAHDMELVFGTAPAIRYMSEDTEETFDQGIVVGTLGYSSLLDKIESTG